MRHTEPPEGKECTMIGKKVTDALNLQMNREFFNARLYLL